MIADEDEVSRYVGVREYSNQRARFRIEDLDGATLV